MIAKVKITLTSVINENFLPPCACNLIELHISFTNFKLRHICVFSIKKAYEFK